MKYMTAELLARLQSRDESVVDAAEETWDKNSILYRDYLASVHAGLPHGVQSLLRRCLHDAKVLTIATEEEGGILSIYLDLGEMEKAAERNIELRYRLVQKGGQPGYSLLNHAELAKHGRPFKQWLYDEIEVVGEGEFAHSILLTGGVELQLTFSGVTCARLNYLFPPINAEKEAGQVRKGA